jgi:uncharacterized protein with HEPN domain
MKKRYLSFLKDIKDCIDRISKYIQQINYDTFGEDELLNELLMAGFIRNLEIMGEAARNIPEDVRTKYPEIPWKKMIGLRNVLIHNYASIDEATIWEIIQTDLSQLRPHILKAIQEEEEKHI